MKPDEVVRTFGIVPGAFPAPAGKVRSAMRTKTIVGQWIASGIFIGIPALAALILLAVAAFAPIQMMSRGICAGIGVFLGAIAALLFSIANRDNQWVELDGDILRAKALYTGRIIEKPVRELNDVLTEVIMVRTLTVKIVEGLNGRIRGFAFRFHDIPKGLKIVRPEMTNVAELVAAVIAKMGEYGELSPEIINFEGKPMVRRVTWTKTLNYSQAAKPKP